MKGKEVPKSVIVNKTILGILLSGVDKIGEQNWVIDKEGGSLKHGEIPISFVSVELNGESSLVTKSIRSALVLGSKGES